MTIELTEQEEAIILQLRRDDEEKKRQKETALNILKTAYYFESWMQANGAGATYSTFCDDFNYVADENEHRPATYERVMAVIKLARGGVA